MRAFAALVLLSSAWSISPAEGEPPAPFIFAAYNLENFRGLEPSASRRPAPPKSEESIAAVVRIVVEIHPDILGVCEMGSREQLAVLQRRLLEAGLPLPESEFVNGPDADRHLALLSRFPITERHSAPDLTFALAGAPHKIERGLLDVTLLASGDFPLRLVGVHLKSRLPVPEGEALIRRHEAEMVRAHVDGILAAAPETAVLLYGDFNDYRNEPTLQTITGVRGQPGYLTELPAADALGDRWTHYWKTADLYARIDYLFASPALWPHIVPDSSHVYRGEGWSQASDHRPVFTTITPKPRR